MAEADVRSMLPNAPQLRVQAPWCKVDRSEVGHMQAMQLGQDSKDACQQAGGAPMAWPVCKYIRQGISRTCE